ncbi:MAG: carboxypeptidase-like regulatory domain-containing protein, partial [Bacteroidota bacterium]
MRRFMLLTFACFLFCVQALAQSKTVSGKVNDATGQPVSGASVLVKGTNSGTTTAADGTFSLSVPNASNILVISYLGLAAQEVNISDRNSVTVALQAATEPALQEVVVVGYGTQRRQDLTGSVAQVNGAKLRDQPIQTFEQGLSGRAVGVNVSLPSGVLNQPPVIRVRGVNSISLSSFPLVVVDGIPV